MMQRSGTRSSAGFWQILLAICATIGLTAFLKYLKRRAQMLKQGQKRPSNAKVQHVVALQMPDLVDDSEQHKAIDNIIQKMNDTLAGVKTSFNRYGTKSLVREAFLQQLGKPDMSMGFTHCIYLIADDLPSLKNYLHSSLHESFVSTAGPFIKMAIVIDTEFGVTFAPEAKQDTIVMNGLLRFQPHVTPDSKVYASFQRAIEDFNGHFGISAALRHVGHGGLNKEDLLKELDWPDKTNGITHCLTIRANSIECLKQLQGNPVYSKWLGIETPHFVNDGYPPALIFYSSLGLATA